MSDTPAALPTEEIAALIAPLGSQSGDVRWRAAMRLREQAAEITALRARVAVLEAVARSAALAIQYTPRGPARDELAARLAEAGVHYRG